MNAPTNPSTDDAANRALIEAAPLLLEALREAEPLLAGLECFGTPAPALVKVRAAIARATRAQLRAVA